MSCKIKLLESLNSSIAPFLRRPPRRPPPFHTKNFFLSIIPLQNLIHACAAKKVRRGQLARAHLTCAPPTHEPACFLIVLVILLFFLFPLPS